MTLGETIIEIRKAKKIKQKDLAAACGLDVSSLRRIEKGKAEPKKSTILNIAKALEINPYYLETGDLDETKAMLTLFSIFMKFDGNICSGAELKQSAMSGTLDEKERYITFDGLNSLITTWKMEYDFYKYQIEKFSEIKSEKLRNEKIEMAKKHFYHYMMSYPQTDALKSGAFDFFSMNSQK